jgi:hypothetical protein
MQGCALRFAFERRDSGAVCARALEGRTGAPPADQGLASSDRGTAAGRSRGRLARSLDASRQSVILLRKHFLLTILHYCYSNKLLDGVRRKSHRGQPRLLRGSMAPGCHSCITRRREAICTQVFAKTDRSCPKCEVPASAGGTTDRGTGGALETRRSLRREDDTPLRQNAAAPLLESRLMAVRNLSLTAIDYVNLYFHWDFPKFNISCVSTSGLPQYLVDSPEGRCISEGRSAAITVGYWAADIRTLATKCCYEVTGGELRVSAGACPRMHRKFGKRLA